MFIASPDRHDSDEPLCTVKRKQYPVIANSQSIGWIVIDQVLDVGCSREISEATDRVSNSPPIALLEPE
jgi:hypothetical protein